jgi:DNA-binding response OmpR family regulator
MSKVLVIEDDELLLALLQNILGDARHEVVTTADGPMGISLYKQHSPDIVLLDLALPSMNGLEVLKRIREFDRNARVVVVTGYGSEESAEVAFRYGASDFVQKPFDSPELLVRIKKVLER